MLSCYLYFKIIFKIFLVCYIMIACASPYQTKCVSFSRKNNPKIKCQSLHRQSDRSCQWHHGDEGLITVQWVQERQFLGETKAWERSLRVLTTATEASVLPLWLKRLIMVLHTFTRKIGALSNTRGSKNWTSWWFLHTTDFSVLLGGKTTAHPKTDANSNNILSFGICGKW